MEINKLKLHTNKLFKMKNFYIDILGFNISNETEKSFKINVGSSVLEFNSENSNDNPYYHFAFNIPSNQFTEAKLWTKDRVTLLLEDGEDEADFSHLPAHSIYFYDPSGNIVELIARYGINENREEPFSSDSMLNICEIGLIVDDPISIGNKLSEIGLYERDNDPISATSLNFMGKRKKGIFVILAQPGRRWLFSEKKSEIYPLEIILDSDFKIIVNPEHKCSIE